MWKDIFDVKECCTEKVCFAKVNKYAPKHGERQVTTCCINIKRLIY
jgi:hypothetical protein